MRLRDWSLRILGPVPEQQGLEIGLELSIKSQRIEFEVLGLIQEFIKCCSGIGPSILKDQSLNLILWTLGSLPELHFFDAGINSRPHFHRENDSFSKLISSSLKKANWLNFKIRKFSYKSHFCNGIIHLKFRKSDVQPLKSCS